MKDDLATPSTTEDRARALVAKWEHGDEAHRKWLRDMVIPDLIAFAADCKAPAGSKDEDFRALVRAVQTWTENHMDQWEKFKYDWVYGTIYVSITMNDPYPDSFDKIDDVQP